MSHGLLGGGTVPSGLLATQALGLGAEVLTTGTIRNPPPTRTVAIRADVTTASVGTSYGVLKPNLAFDLGALSVESSTSNALLAMLQFGVVTPCTIAGWATGSILDRFLEALHFRTWTLAPNSSRAFLLQLKSLLAYDTDFIEAKVSPSLASFEGLAEMLRLNPTIKHPNLSIDARGSFVASWVPYRRAKLSMTFDGLLGGNWMATDRSAAEKAQGKGLFRIDGTQGVSEPYSSWMHA